MSSLVKTVHKALENIGVTLQNKKLLVGVSGGPDSVALLDLFYRLKDSWHLVIHVAHLDHLLRPTSNEDAEFVQNLAEKHDLAFHTQAFDVAALAKAEIYDNLDRANYGMN